MKTPKILFLFSCLTLSNNLFAQDETDAFRYSMLSPMGTARSIGFGNASGAVGGDFSCMSLNPAGLGIYRRSEFTITPSLKMNNMNANYLGNESDATAAKFNFNNLGLVMTWSEKGRRYDNSDWKAISFGIGFNRLADFRNDYIYRGTLSDPNGTNHYASFSQLFLDAANANPNNATDSTSIAYLGYQSFVINQDTTGKFYTLANVKTGLNQMNNVAESGGYNETVISLGGNYKERLMLGATIGLPSIHYTRNRSFEETDATTNASNYFSYFNYSEKLTTKGNGVNLKLGIIIKPSDKFRLGVAIHTPTIFTMTDVYNTSIESNTENYKAVYNATGDTNPYSSASTVENQYTYTLITPMRSIFSGMAFLGKIGFISADYEYINYQTMRYKFAGYESEAALRNDRIKQMFGAAHNIRLGIELKYDDFFFRGGYGLYGNPFKNSSVTYSRNEYSLGIGYRSGDFFTDIAYTHLNLTATEQPYQLETYFVPSARLTTNRNMISWTFGWKL
jgi:hypothetical protein